MHEESVANRVAEKQRGATRLRMLELSLLMCKHQQADHYDDDKETVDLAS